MVLNSQLIKRWQKAATEYTIARLAKRDTSDIVLSAYNIFKTGKVRLNEERLSFLTRELVSHFKKRAAFDLVVLPSGALGTAIDSARPRKGENLAPVVNLLKTGSYERKAGNVVSVTASAVLPVKEGKFWSVRLEGVVDVKKSQRAVPDTAKEIIKRASEQGILFSSMETLLALKKIVKVTPPEADASTELRTEPREESFSLDVALIKAEGEKQIAYGVVYEPDRVDTDGDSASAEAIEEAAHQYLADFSDINLMHERPLGNRVKVVESYIAPVDFNIGDQYIKKGSWIMAVKVDDDDLWKAIKEKKLNAFSIEGTGIAM